MKKLKQICLWLGVVLLVADLSGCAGSIDPVLASPKNITSSQKKATNFELKDLQGTRRKLSDYAGKKVYVRFWATWCPICLAGLEELNTLPINNKDFAVVTVVSPDFRGEKKSADFIKWFSGLNYKNITVLMDEGGKVATQYGVRGYPTSVLIGNDGTIFKTIIGENTNEQIKSQFKVIK